jgi:hypothetical protein
MTSMEEFGPVAVDYFNGQTVEDVSVAGDDPSDGVWWLRFEGGGMIANTDPEVELPPKEMIGLALTLTVLGVEETVGKPTTMLYFGSSTEPRKYVVALNPTEYAMCDEVHTRGTWVYAQRSSANMDQTPPDPSPDRIVDGPVEPGDGS